MFVCAVWATNLTADPLLNGPVDVDIMGVCLFVYMCVYVFVCVFVCAVWATNLTVDPPLNGPVHVYIMCVCICVYMCVFVCLCVGYGRLI